MKLEEYDIWPVSYYFKTPVASYKITEVFKSKDILKDYTELIRRHFSSYHMSTVFNHDFKKYFQYRSKKKKKKAKRVNLNHLFVSSSPRGGEVTRPPDLTLALKTTSDENELCAKVQPVIFPN